MILNFEQEDGEMFFEFAYDGFIIGGSIATSKGLSVLRRELGIMEKFEAISHEYPCGKKITESEVKRKLNKEGNKTIHIDAPEFDLLYNYIASVPWTTGVSVKRALKTLDWLGQCQKMSA